MNTSISFFAITSAASRDISAAVRAGLLPSQRAQAHVAHETYRGHPGILPITTKGCGDVDARRRGGRWKTVGIFPKQHFTLFSVVQKGTLNSPPSPWFPNQEGSCTFLHPVCCRTSLAQSRSLQLN